MARSSLAHPAVVDLLRPFIVTSVHSGQNDFSDVEPAAREVFIKSDLSKDPNRFNVFMFVLNPQGQVVHEFHGLPSGRRSVSPERSDYEIELRKAWAKLKLPEAESQKRDRRQKGLPDLKSFHGGAPAGVRIFIRQDDPSNSHFSKMPVVETVPFSAEQWKLLSYAPQGRKIEAAALRSWLVGLYPAGIRTADERKPFQTISGILALEPAGADEKHRSAFLHGQVRLMKGDETESEFEGELQAVLFYRADTSVVHSVRGVIEGVYLYRLRGTFPQQLRIVIESRPE